MSAMTINEGRLKDIMNAPTTEPIAAPAPVAEAQLHELNIRLRRVP